MALDPAYNTGGSGSGDVDSVNNKTGAVNLNTDDIPEGSTNKYYTDSRVDNRISQTAFVETLTAASGNTFAEGEIGYETASGVVKANAGATSTATGRLLMATEAISAESSGVFAFSSYLFNTSGLTEGPQWLDTTSGGFTATQPSATDEIVRLVGYAISSTAFRFAPDGIWLTVA